MSIIKKIKCFFRLHEWGIESSPLFLIPKELKTNNFVEKINKASEKEMVIFQKQCEIINKNHPMILCKNCGRINKNLNSELQLCLLSRRKKL